MSAVGSILLASVIIKCTEQNFLTSILKYLFNRQYIFVYSSTCACHNRWQTWSVK